MNHPNGQRTTDPTFDRLAAVNLHIARYRYIIGFAFMVAGGLGVKVAWPSERLALLERNTMVLQGILIRQDSVQQFNALIMTGLAKSACQRSTEEQRAYLPFPCQRLLDGGLLNWRSMLESGR